jgi:asparagine synthase (glutamine-hydrolysing)
MCGLVTIISANPVPGLGELAGRMLELIAHRGPDGRGIAAFDQTGQVGSADCATIALAHCRLAIQDTTDAGHQPMGTADGRHWLSYNGEIYNFKQLRQELEEKGIRFNSGSDTEVLLHLLADQGKAALPRLDGQFAFCFYDRYANTVLLARDRFGIKPLYLWSPDLGTLCIASEIKAFTAHPDWNPRLNTHRARDFLERGLLDHVPGETMFADVRQVIPGTAIAINLNEWAQEPTQMVARAPRPCETNTWFNLENRPPPAEANLGDLLAQSVRNRLISDVPVGSCLSGGIDSSAIVALTAQAMAESGATLDTIHARTTEPTLDESDHARAAAEAAGANLHQVTPDGSDLFDRLDDLVWIQDEPFASPSIFAQFKVMEQAKALGLKVMLDGQGADEQLAGYHAFFKAALAEYFSRGNFVAAHIHAHTAKSLHGYGLIKQVAEALATFTPPAIRTRLRRNKITSATKGLDPFDAMPHSPRSVRNLSLDQLTRGSLPMLLHWEDRNAMAFGVEARVPFLDHNLVAASLALPSGDKIRRGVTKWALRQALRGTVPDAILDRTDKVAFATPEKSWLLTDPRWKDRLEEGLKAASPLLKPEAADRLRAMLTDRPDAPPYDNAVWRVICFGAWVRQYSVNVL